MKIVIGLGNPGARYARTRHNLGFRVLDLLAVELGAPAFTPGPRAVAARTRLRGEEVLLLKPVTYMNRSGEALRALPIGGEVAAGDLLVVADDVNLPLGRMRMRPGGSCGGHNGLASIERALGTAGYPRLRVGIGRPQDAVAADADGGEKARTGLVDYVLGEFAPGEEKVLEVVLPAAARAARDWIERGLDYCRDRYNGAVFTTLTGGET